MRLSIALALALATVADAAPRILNRTVASTKATCPSQFPPGKHTINLAFADPSGGCKYQCNLPLLVSCGAFSDRLRVNDSVGALVRGVCSGVDAAVRGAPRHRQLARLRQRCVLARFSVAFRLLWLVICSL